MSSMFSMLCLLLPLDLPSTKPERSCDSDSDSTLTCAKSIYCINVLVFVSVKHINHAQSNFVQMYIFVYVIQKLKNSTRRIFAPINYEFKQNVQLSSSRWHYRQTRYSQTMPKYSINCRFEEIAF